MNINRITYRTIWVQIIRIIVFHLFTFPSLKISNLPPQSFHRLNHFIASFLGPSSIPLAHRATRASSHYLYVISVCLTFLFCTIVPQHNFRARKMAAISVKSRQLEAYKLFIIHSNWKGYNFNFIIFIDRICSTSFNMFIYLHHIYHTTYLSCHLHLYLPSTSLSSC